MIKRQQLVEQVIEHLSEAISSGAYNIGARLPAEPLLMEELGVGRSTLREAVRVLAHSGVLEVRQGNGTYVRAISASDEPLAQQLRRARLREVQEVRRSLEIEVVRLAARRRQDADIARIGECLNSRKEAAGRGDLAAALDADMAFHCAIAESGGNAVFTDLYRTFALTLREALAMQWESENSKPPETESLHVRLLDAIANRDEEAAVSITITLLDRHEAADIKIRGER